MPFGDPRYFADSSVSAQDNVSSFWLAAPLTQKVIEVLCGLLALGQINKPALNLSNAGQGIAVCDELCSYMFAIRHAPEAVKMINFPISRDYTYLGLLIPRLQFHTNPIFARCWFTLASSSATRLAICGIGVS